MGLTRRSKGLYVSWMTNLVQWMLHRYASDLLHFTFLFLFSNERIRLMICHCAIGFFQIRNNAATTIQSFIRGYQTRRKLESTSKAFAKLQKVYRRKTEEKRFYMQQNHAHNVQRIHEMQDRRKGFVKSKVNQLKVCPVC